MMYLRIALLLLCFASSAKCLSVGAPITRRDAMAAALFSLPVAAYAAEPEPARVLTEQEMAARVARKAELLKKQGMKQRTDAKILYGADFQMGKRESTNSKSSSSGVAGFLLPGDVGGLNLGNPFTGAPGAERVQGR